MMMGLAILAPSNVFTKSLFNSAVFTLQFNALPAPRYSYMREFLCEKNGQVLKRDRSGIIPILWHSKQ